MYVRIFFSFLFSGLMIQFLKVFKVIHNLSFLHNFKKSFFILFNQIYFQKLDLNMKSILRHIKCNNCRYSNKIRQFFPDFDNSLKFHSKLLTFMLINKTANSANQKEKMRQFGTDFYGEIISSIIFYREKLDKEILFLFNPFILIFNSINIIISFLIKLFNFKLSCKSVKIFCFLVTFFIFLIGYLKIYYHCII